jgi:hypothetical protein
MLAIWDFALARSDVSGAKRGDRHAVLAGQRLRRLGRIHAATAQRSGDAAVFRQQSHHH